VLGDDTEARLEAEGDDNAHGVPERLRPVLEGRQERVELRSDSIGLLVGAGLDSRCSVERQGTDETRARDGDAHGCGPDAVVWAQGEGDAGDGVGLWVATAIGNAAKDPQGLAELGVSGQAGIYLESIIRERDVERRAIDVVGELTSEARVDSSS